MKRLIAFGALIAAFALGHWFGAHRRSGDAAASRDGSGEPIRPIAVSRTNVSVQDSVSQVYRDLASLAGADRSSAVRAAFVLASDAELQTALRQLWAEAPSRRRDRELRIAFEVWGGRDPTAALEYLRTQAEALGPDLRQILTSGVLDGWMVRSPDAAFGWACAQEGNTTSVRHALERLAEREPAKAADLAGRLTRWDPADLQDLFASIVRVPIDAGSYDEALRLIQRAPAGAVRDNLSLQLADVWAHYQPSSAAQWILALPEGPLRAQLMAQVTESWATVDAPAAAKFALTLPGGSARDQSLANAIVAWANQDVRAAGQWLEQLPVSPGSDAARAAVATANAAQNANFDQAIDWAEKIAVEDTRMATLRQLIDRWKDRDRAGLLDYLQQTARLPPAERSSLLAYASR